MGASLLIEQSLARFTVLIQGVAFIFHEAIAELRLLSAM
jgi:hypothetical protein